MRDVCVRSISVCEFGHDQRSCCAEKEHVCACDMPGARADAIILGHSATNIGQILSEPTDCGPMSAKCLLISAGGIQPTSASIAGGAGPIETARSGSASSAPVEPSLSCPHPRRLRAASARLVGAPPRLRTAGCSIRPPRRPHEDSLWSWPQARTQQLAPKTCPIGRGDHVGACGGPGSGGSWVCRRPPRRVGSRTSIGATMLFDPPQPDFAPHSMLWMLKA